MELIIQKTEVQNEISLGASKLNGEPANQKEHE
jgi:hypothetical protein